MTLGLVIVNYNVRFFLEQCLESVFRSARQSPSGEPVNLSVWVVDNASVDGSVEMLRNRFPQVNLIANNDNVGFAKANNQALRLMNDLDYVLLLNPDTIVEQDTLVKCVDFFASHPDCGGLGVKMINGEGEYLKESKRGFPTPEASFFKISGLIRLFPHNKRVAAYYMGHLDDNDVNPVDILPGAFLMVRHDTLQKVGLLDESYFMYGEDIDFSWRIRLAGYKNYYLPTARIIHYKGESTKRGSMNYVYTFYNAMSIFVRHYFSGRNARIFNILLHAAIWTRAALSFLQRALKAILLPLADFAVAFAGFVAIKHLWASLWADNVNYYPPEYTWLVIPLYILALMGCSWLYGGYVKPLRIGRIIKGMAVGCALLLLFYSLLDESMRYSRALLLLGCAWTLISTLAIRGFLSCLHVDGYDLRRRRQRRCLIVGSLQECSRISNLYTLWGYNHRFSTLSDPSRLADAIHVHKPDEVVFSGCDIPVYRIIDLMTTLSDNGAAKGVEFKIAPQSTDFVIGSNHIHSAEDLYTEDLNTLASPLNRRNKRLFDVIAALLLLLLSPFLSWFQKKHGNYFRHCFHVLLGKKTWVGDSPRAVFSPEQSLRRADNDRLNEDVRQRLRLRYSRNYRILSDIQILTRNWRRI